jgi:hypothetical protein
MSKDMRVSVRLANSKEAAATVMIIDGVGDPMEGLFDPLVGRKTPALVGPGSDGRSLRVQIEGQKAAAILQIDSSGIGERLLSLFDAEKRVTLTAIKDGDSPMLVVNHEEQ